MNIFACLVTITDRQMCGLTERFKAEMCAGNPQLFSKAYGTCCKKIVVFATDLLTKKDREQV